MIAMEIATLALIQKYGRLRVALTVLPAVHIGIGLHGTKTRAIQTARAIRNEVLGQQDLLFERAFRA